MIKFLDLNKINQPYENAFQNKLRNVSFAKPLQHYFISLIESNILDQNQFKKITHASKISRLILSYGSARVTVSQLYKILHSKATIYCFW